MFIWYSLLCWSYLWWNENYIVQLAIEPFCGVAMISLVFSTYRTLKSDFKILSSVNPCHEYYYDLHIFFDQHTSEAATGGVL